MSDKENNLELWGKVEKTNPKYTKKAKVGGNDITSIAPQFQIKNATEQFGSYGITWGFKDMNFDYSLVNTPVTIPIMKGKYPNLEVIGSKESIMGLVVFKALFFYPNGQFPIVNSVKLFTDNAKTKVDDNFAKKVETDTLTKALSKLGFNADIFLGLFDDVKYVNEMKGEFSKDNLSTLEKGTHEWDNIVKLIGTSDLIQTQQIQQMHNVSDELMEELVQMMKVVIEDKKKILTKETYDKAVVSENKKSIQTLLTKYKMTAVQRKGLKAQFDNLK